ncbi:MAG: HU family DNA-binding protein, partial [SAR324 cluster bacterium]|nr:HU family DNA-binding protein [SAR324 cluster bacterium]
MVKADVVRRVRLETGISQGEAEDLINELLEIMRQTLESGDNLMVTNFG